jgi:hypothetical protein
MSLPDPRVGRPAEPAHLTLGHAGRAHRPDQVVDLARVDALDIRLLDDRHGSPFGPPTRLQEPVREVRARAELRDRQLAAAGPAVEQREAVAVALTGPIGRPLVARLLVERAVSAGLPEGPRILKVASGRDDILRRLVGLSSRRAARVRLVGATECEMTGILPVSSSDSHLHTSDEPPSIVPTREPALRGRTFHSILGSGSGVVLGVVVYAAILLAGVSLSSPRDVGDGQQYMAMAMNIADLHGPGLTPADLESVEARLDKLGGSYGRYPITNPALLDHSGRQLFSHFWFYPALAAPGVWLASELGLHPNLGFTLVNVLLLLVSFALVSRQVPISVALLLFVGPIMWWVDKPGVEPLMFAMIAIAVASINTKPWWSFVALAIAASQNPPVLFVLPIFWLAAVAIRRDWLHSQAFWIGSVAAAGIALLHPLYYELSLGIYTPQVVDGGAKLRLPSLQGYLSNLLDLNIGLIPNVPQWALLVGIFGALVLAMRCRRALIHPSVVASVLAGMVFMFGFSQTTHFNSGGQGPSRYALWLIPLAIPLMGLAARTWGRRIRAAVALMTAVSCVSAWQLYQPQTYEGLYLYPTQIASLVWNYLPALDNPIPEIFYDRNAHQEGQITSFTSVGTPSCTKVLLVGGQPAAGCSISGPLPAACSASSDFCYANLVGTRYDYVSVDPSP